MSDSRGTRFKLDLPGFELEISGDQRFVEDLYRQISQDIIPLMLPVEDDFAAAPPTLVTKRQTTYTWVYGITDYYSKVYAVSDGELGEGILGRVVNPVHLRRIYVEVGADDGLFAKLAGDQKTLWAEFTPAGRERFQGQVPPMGRPSGAGNTLPGWPARKSKADDDG